MTGRGHRFTRVHRAWEWFARWAYVGHWPARAAAALGLQGRVIVRELCVALPDYPRQKEPFRVAFASDFHAGPHTHERHLEDACRALQEARADLLLLGGDFVSYDAAHIDRLAAALGNVAAPCGRFAVMGNHDLWADDRHVVATLERAGIHVLVNEHVRLPEPCEHVRLFGMDEPWTGDPSAPDPDFDTGRVRLVVMHSPSGLIFLDCHRVHVAFCGHTHGGQIALPGGVPILMSRGPLCRRYAYGLFPLAADRYLVVSRGVGFSGLPLRAFAPAEVVLCTIGGSA